MNRMTPMKDVPLMDLVRKMVETAAAWRGLARQYYDAHQALAPCACAVCHAYQARIASEAQEQKP